MTVDAAALAATTEKTLCSAVMWSRRLPTFDVTPEMFANEGHRQVWEAILACWPDVEPPEVAQRLAETGKLEVVGGINAFWQVANSDKREDPEAPAVRLLDWHFRRQARRKAQQVLQASADLSIDPSSLLDELETIPRRPSTLTVHTGDDIRGLPAPEWLVDGHIQDGVAVLFGPWSAGKSFVAVQLAVHVASGRPWWGHDVQQRRVLYLAAEGVAGLGARLGAAADDSGVGLDGVGLCGDPINLTQDRDVAALDRAVSDHRAGLLIVDTWARVTAGADENDNGQVGKAVEALDRVRSRRGCAIWVVHHTGTQETSRPRGASALPAAADTMLAVANQAGTVTVSSIKQKDGEDFRPIRLKIVPSGVSAVLQQPAGARDRGVDDVARARLLEILREGPVLKASIRSKHGAEMVDELLRHADVNEGVDEFDRPVLEAMSAPMPL